METIASLHSAYRRRFRDFEEHFAAVSGYPSVSAVHDMRVALKRLRTIFNLGGAMTPDFDARRAFAEPRKLFRAAGRIRNLQIIQAKVYDASRSAGLDLSEFYNRLKEAEIEEAAKFDRVCGRFRGKTLVSAWKQMEAALIGWDDRLVGFRMAGRLMALIKEMRRERSMRRDVRRLHFLRSKAKEARYTLELLQECGLTKKDGVLLNDGLKNVHQPLGCWHDEEIVLEFLGEFRRTRNPGPLFSPKSYIEFSRQTKTRKAECLAAFEAAWAELMGFLGRGYGRRVLLRAAAVPSLEGPVPVLGDSPDQDPLPPGGGYQID